MSSAFSAAALSSLLLSFAEPQHSGGLLAYRVGKAETISQGTIEHAVILVDGGKILAVGEDLPVERGIPVIEKPSWTVMPGLVNCYTRIGLDGEAGGGFTPAAEAKNELWPRQDVWGELLELGVTTLGLYPPGTGIPGMAVAIRPHGETVEEMVLAEHAYLKAFLQSDPGSKKMLRKGFEEVDKYEEKVAKAREKWEKEQEKKDKKNAGKKKKEGEEQKESGKEEEKKEEKKDEKKEDKQVDEPAVSAGAAQAQDEDKDKDKEEEKKKADEKKKEGEVFVPPPPEPDIKPFVDLRRGKLAALFRIQKAGDYLHLLQVIEEEKEMVWRLRVPLRHDIDLFFVADKLGERKLDVVLDPLLTFQPNSRRERNIPAEVAAAGAHVALVPPDDSLGGYRVWLTAVGSLIRAGLTREAALASVTLVPARVLGLDARLGSLEAGKDANLVFFDGDPFEPSSRVQAVMLEGELVYERSER